MNSLHRLLAQQVLSYALFALALLPGQSLVFRISVVTSGATLLALTIWQGKRWQRGEKSTVVINDDGFENRRPAHVTDAVRLDEIVNVAFYKRDAWTTDLIWCDIHTENGLVRSFNEDHAQFKELITLLEKLPGFDSGWFGKVSQPPFEECFTIAFNRSPPPT